ncbi:MAG: hypothetical protein ABIS18_12125 [Actinomycetota bacterium]
MEIAAGAEGSGVTTPSRIRPTFLVGAWGVLITSASLWGAHLRRSGLRIQLDAAPLYGRFDARIGPRVVVVLAFAAIAVYFGPRIARRLSWRHLILVGFLASGIWAVTLAFTDGVAAIGAPLAKRNEYLRGIAFVSTPGVYVHHFIAQIKAFPSHVQAHPPLIVLIFWGLSKIGLAGAGWAAVVVILAWASVVPAVLVTAREIAGATVARAAFPFLVIAPFAIWAATSADALFAAVGAWSVALLVLATRESGLKNDLFAVSGGLLLGATLFLSYGLILLGFIPLLVSLARRRFRPLLIGALGLCLVVGLFGYLGLWWWDGLRAAIGAYHRVDPRQGSAAFFFVANLGALALAVGPACLIGVTQLRDRKAWLLVGGGLVAILLANLSGLSRGEVERIWLPFVPWLMLGTSSIGGVGRGRWLTIQATLAVLIQTMVRTHW